MTPTYDTLTETEPHSAEVTPEEAHHGTTALPDAAQNGFGAAISEESPVPPRALDKTARKLEKKKLKALKKAGKKKLVLKEKKSSAKILAGTFPMVELIDEQVRTSI